MSSSHNLSVSIVIPTYNGAYKIEKLLNSISQQPREYAKETIVVIDGSTDQTQEVIAHFKAPFQITTYVQTNQGRSIARNKGVEMATNPYLLFIDDDMRLSSSVLEKHVQHHLFHPQSILVGKVELDNGLLQKDFDFYMLSLYESWERNYPCKSQLSAHNLKFTTQHLSMPKPLFEKLGGFDARLTDAEDYDIGMRALVAGIPIYYDPSIIAWHDDFPTCAKYIKRQIEYKSSHEQLKKLGKNYSQSLFEPLKSPSNLIKKTVLRFLSRSFWVTMVDKGRLGFLPKKWRHKLYASIVYAHTLKGLNLI